MNLKICYLLFALSLTRIASAQKNVIADQYAQIRNLTDGFHSIEVHGGIEVFVSQSENTAMAVSTGGNKEAGINTEVRDSVLIITVKNGGTWRNMVGKFRVYIACKTLKVITATGASSLQLAGTFTSDSLTLALSGASDFRGNVIVQRLMLDLSGASDVTVSGAAAYVNIDSRGASDVKGFALAANVCTINASGASDVQLQVTESATVSMSGASTLYYKGTGDIKIAQLKGSSDVKNRN